MEELLLLAFGFGFALLYVVIALLRTLRRTAEIGAVDILTAFLVALVPLTALTISARNGLPDDRVSVGTLLIAAGLALFGILFMLIELTRPQRLKQSRGLLTLGVSILMAMSALAVPLTGAYFSLPPRQATPESSTVNTVGIQATDDPADEFFAVFNQVVQVVADESGLTFDDVLMQLDQGKTVAQLVSNAGGDIEQVIDDITDIMQDFLRDLVAQNRVDRVQASLGIAGMEVVVRYAVQNDLRSLQRTGQRDSNATQEPTPGEGTPTRSFFAFLTATFTPDALSDASAAEETPIATSQSDITPTSTPFPTITQPPTAEPSATRTPRPTATIEPTRTRYAYVTRTPTLTPTLPSPCVVVMNFNVNVRQDPATDAPLVTTIPFETAVNGFGRNDDSTWWFVEYNGSAGWVKDEFVTVTSSCSFLPIRER